MLLRDDFYYDASRLCCDIDITPMMPLIMIAAIATLLYLRH